MQNNHCKMLYKDIFASLFDKTMDTISARETNLKVEQLLKLKRFEKPSEEYWEKFQRELHRKKLQALVGHRPWHTMLLEHLSRRLFPLWSLLATASLLVSFFVVNRMTIPVNEDVIAGLASNVVVNHENAFLSEAVPSVKEVAEVNTATAVIELSEPSFVVAAFTAEPETHAQFTKVAVSKNMPKVNSSNIHYIAGHAFTHVAEAHIIQ